MAKKATSIESRFWSKVAKKGEGECWLWLGSKTVSGGYGQIARTRKLGPVRANRVSYELVHGKIEKDICVLHKCDTPACVNPKHLFLGTRGENCKDMGEKGRWVNQFMRGPAYV